MFTIVIQFCFNTTVRLEILVFDLIPKSIPSELLYVISCAMCSSLTCSNRWRQSLGARVESQCPNVRSV